MQHLYLLIVLGALAGALVVLILLPLVLGLGAVLASRASARQRRPPAAACSLEGRHAVITGGSSGIGRACAAALLEVRQARGGGTCDLT